MTDVNIKENYKGTLNFTWLMFDINMKILAEKIKGSGIHFKNIFAICRGGWVVGVYLSHLLNLPIIEDEYDIGSHSLVVDDISDTGNTLLGVKENIPICTIATLFYNEWSKVKPDFYAWKQDRDETCWIEFPWEAK